MATYVLGTRRLEEMILEARKLSCAEQYSYTEGWDDNTLVDIFNLGLDRCYNELTQIDSPPNIEEFSTNVIATQQEYDIPIDVYMALRIVDVRYLYAGPQSPWAFVTLRQGMIQDRFSYPTNIPDTYCIRNGKMLLSPTPNVTTINSLVVNYQKRMRSLDIRRGKVTSFTTGPVTFQLNFTVLSQKDTNLKANGESVLDKVDYISLVNTKGEPIVDAIPMGVYNFNTFLITPLPSYTMTATEQANLTAALAAGVVYVVQGDYASTHSQLDRQCEDHLIEFASLRLLRLQSASEPTQIQIQAEEDVLRRLRDAYRRYRPSVMPVVWQERLRPRSWPWGRRGMF